jgi:prolipoprotein diacylglyceryltransferase
VAPILQVFGLSIQAAPLALLAGAVAGLWLAGRLAPRRGIDGAAISDAGFYGVLAGLAAARAGYVLVNWPAYAAEPWSALIPGTSALLPWSGWPAGIAVAAWVLRRRRAFTRHLPDVLAPGAAAFGIGAALAGHLSGDTFGVAAELPWSVAAWGALRHPVAVYEMIALALIAAGLVWLFRRPAPAGAVALAGVALYAFARVAVDGFRDGVPLVLGVRVTQAAGLVIGGVALWLLASLLADAARAPAVEDAPGQP